MCCLEHKISITINNYWTKWVHFFLEASGSELVLGDFVIRLKPKDGFRLYIALISDPLKEEPLDARGAAASTHII